MRPPPFLAIAPPLMLGRGVPVSLIWAGGLAFHVEGRWAASWTLRGRRLAVPRWGLA